MTSPLPSSPAEPQETVAAEEPTEFLAERAKDLEDRLDVRNRQVAVLTEQLERTAEQLDRLQRSGAERKSKPSTGSASLPAELVETHQKTVEEMQRVVQQWDDMQAGMMLGRIEMQLGELRDLVIERLTNLPMVADPERPHDLAALLGQTRSENESTGEAPPEGSLWETLKSSLLDSPTVGLASADLHDEEHTSPIPDPPCPIDPTTLSHEALATALDERDVYIAYLIRRLRHSETRHDRDAVPSDAAPHDVVRIHELQSRLEERLRMAEVELSLERARLGREQVRLRHQQEQLDKRIAQNPTPTDAGAEPISRPDRRWLRYFGVEGDKVTAAGRPR